MAFLHVSCERRAVEPVTAARYGVGEWRAIQASMQCTRTRACVNVCAHTRALIPCCICPYLMLGTCKQLTQIAPLCPPPWFLQARS